MLSAKKRYNEEAYRQEGTTVRATLSGVIQGELQKTVLI